MCMTPAEMFLLALCTVLAVALLRLCSRMYALLAEYEEMLRGWQVSHDALEHVITRQQGRPWTDVGREVMESEFRLVLEQAGEEVG